VITDTSLLAHHVVNYFKNVFCTNFSLQDQLLVDEVIPNLVSDSVNALLTMLPSYEEIKNAVFSLNKDSAPGPDGYGAFFYQTYWEIIHQDVVNVVLQFFTSGWIMPNFNYNTLILVPKTQNADSIDQFRPIAMANFKGFGGQACKNYANAHLKGTKRVYSGKKYQGLYLLNLRSYQPASQEIFWW
jgi:hypothetical protein